MKKWDVRRDETIAFLRTARVATNGNRRELIADLLRDKYPLDQASSDQLSQGRNWDQLNLTGVKGKRKYRRAIIAIRTQILGYGLNEAKHGLDGLSDQALGGILGATLGTAYRHEMRELELNLLALRTAPGLFLESNPVRLNRISNLPSQSGQSYFYYDHKDPTPTFRFATPRYFRGGEVRLTGGGRCAHIPVYAYHVGVRQYPVIRPNLGVLTGDVIQSHRIMVTEEMTGCSFMYEAEGPNMTAMHIQPGGDPLHGGRHEQLVATLRQFTGFLNPPSGRGPGADVFGCTTGWGRKGPPLDYPAIGYLPTECFISLVAVLRNGTWELWAQQRQRRADPKEIQAVWRVNPPNQDND